MGWIERDATKHKHDYPTTGDSKVAIGDRWQCACGLVFRVTKSTREYDQRDSSSWTVLEWTPEPRSRSELPTYPAPTDYYGPYGSGTPFGS